MLEGIGPESLFQERSNDSTSSKLPMLLGIGLDKLFLDKC
jgi:hypothetical protein